MATWELDDLARRQFGAISTSQLRTVLTDHQIEGLVRRRLLVPIRRAVFRSAGAPITWEMRMMAAHLAVPHSVVSHRAAARLHGMRSTQLLELSVAEGRRVRLAGARVHHSNVLLGQGTVVHPSGLVLTSPAATILGLSAVLGFESLHRVFDEAVRAGLLTADELADAVARVRARGRRRTTAVDELLDRWLPQLRNVESALEARVGRWLVAADLAPVAQFWVVAQGRRYCLDYAWPEARVHLDVDGFSFHDGRRSFDRDRAREDDLRLAGWLGLHATSTMSRREVVAKVEQALAIRRGAA